jgi:hypothetical protein
MNIRFHFLTGPALVAAAVLSVATARSAPPQSRSSAGASPAISNAIPRSAFVVPTNPREGRDPFFPNSTLLWGAASKSPKQTLAPEASLLVLQGLSGTAGRKLAIISNRTLAEGEETEVNTPGGRIRFRCVEIKSDSVIIEAGGERRELRLRSSN